MPIKKTITGVVAGAATAGIKKAKAGGSGREIAQAAVGGAGVPSFGGRRDKVVGALYDKAAPVVAGAVKQAVTRTENFFHGRNNS